MTAVSVARDARPRATTKTTAIASHTSGDGSSVAVKHVAGASTGVTHPLRVPRAKIP
jgi:hypothetical protein